MSATPELEKIRKVQILTAAVRTISEKGHANVKMDDIVDASGLSKGGIAHYYSSKEELFNAAFETYFDHIFQIIEEILEEKHSPLEKLLGFEELFNPDRVEVQLAYPLIYDLMTLAVHHNEYRNLFQNWVDRWIALLKGVIDDGIEQDLIVDLDSAKMARTVSAIYQGIATRWYLGDDHHTVEWAVESFRAAIGGLFQPYIVDEGLDQD